MNYSSTHIESTVPDSKMTFGSTHAGIWNYSTQKEIFKRLLDAIAKPGSIHDLADVLAESSALTGVLASLLDRNASLSDPFGLIDEHTWTLVGAKPSPMDTASYIVCDGLGRPTRIPKPDPAQRAAASTLIVQSQRLGIGELSLSICGPTMRHKKPVWLAGVDVLWFTRGMQWKPRETLGIDVIFVDQRRMMTLPRTTRMLDIVAGCL